MGRIYESRNQIGVEEQADPPSHIFYLKKDLKMNTMFDQIKRDLLTARKSQDKVATSILKTLVGDLENARSRANNLSTEGELTDETVTAVVKKFVKDIDFTLENTNDQETKKSLSYERDTLIGYLPVQLTEAQLREEIKGAIDGQGADNIGKVMGILNSKFKGEFDGALASKLIREMLNV